MPAADAIDRIAPTRRPDDRVIGYQNWSKLLFVHWRIPAAALHGLVPERLAVDTFDGSAWIGLVPFHMSGVRPWWSPPVPLVSSFHETNVRTYVHLDGADPGVWFFSLDAASSLAVRIARWRWKLNYFRADMQIRESDGVIRYRSQRLWPGPVGPGAEIDAKLGDRIGSLHKDVPAGQAAPGTLEHFLVERYLLYAQGPDGVLHRGQVHHTPYPLREARVIRLTQSLLRAANLRPPADHEHVLYSDGVNVEIFPLRPV